MGLVKPVREFGFVVGKEISEAREAGQSFDGKRSWAAKPIEYFIDVVSCDEDDFSEENGFLNGTRVKYPVSETVFEQVRFGDYAKVKYAIKQFGDRVVCDAISFELIARK